MDVFIHMFLSRILSLSCLSGFAYLAAQAVVSNLVDRKLFGYRFDVFRDFRSSPHPLAGWTFCRRLHLSVPDCDFHDQRAVDLVLPCSSGTAGMGA